MSKQELKMGLYQPSAADDALLIQWFARMGLDGDLEQTFLPDLHIASRFIAYFQAPRVLVIEWDDEGITVAGWFDPLLTGAAFGVWVRQDRRHLPASVRTVERMLEIGLKTYTCIFSITKQPVVVDLCERLGYAVLALIPGFWAPGEAATVLLLTADSFQQRPIRRSKWAEEKAAIPLAAGLKPPSAMN